jgi:hypothetical protein
MNPLLAALEAMQGLEVAHRTRRQPVVWCRRSNIEADWQ